MNIRTLVVESLLVIREIQHPEHPHEHAVTLLDNAEHTCRVSVTAIPPETPTPLAIALALRSVYTQREDWEL